MGTIELINIHAFIFCISFRFQTLINATDGKGKAPLHLAIEQRRFARVDILLCFGAGTIV